MPEISRKCCNIIFFFPAGAELIITNTYQANVDLFLKHLGLSEEDGYNLIKHAVYLAKMARNRYMKELPLSGMFHLTLHTFTYHSSSKLEVFHSPVVTANNSRYLMVRTFQPTRYCPVNSSI